MKIPKKLVHMTGKVLFYLDKKGPTIRKQIYIEGCSQGGLNAKVSELLKMGLVESENQYNTVVRITKEGCEELETLLETEKVERIHPDDIISILQDGEQKTVDEITNLLFDVSQYAVKKYHVGYKLKAMASTGIIKVKGNTVTRYSMPWGGLNIMVFFISHMVNRKGDYA